MKPKFKDRLAWEQAQLLMQPAFIRVLDNLRKQLEESNWQGTYKEIETPYPGYLLCLTRQDKSVEINIWDLCYQVCFREYNYPSTHVVSEDDDLEVEIDTRLIDETGEIDWQLIEAKAQHFVQQMFNNLP